MGTFGIEDKLHIRFERRLDIHAAVPFLDAAVIYSGSVDDLRWQF